MINQLPYIGQSNNVYGSPAPNQTAGYSTLNTLAGGLIGTQRPGAGPVYGYGGAQQSGALTGYLGTSAPRSSPYSYGGNAASYATTPSSGYGWSDARSAVTGYYTAGQAQAYTGSYATAYPPAQSPYAGYAPQQPYYGYSPSQQMQSYQFGGAVSGMFGWGWDGGAQTQTQGYAPQPYTGGGQPALPGRPNFPQVPPQPLPVQPVPPSGGLQETSNAIATRLIGNADNRNAISFGGQDPRTNVDGRQLERQAVWDILRLDDSLLYDADRRMLVRPYTNGQRADVVGIDAFTGFQANHPDNQGLARLETSALLGRLPAPETLLGSQPPTGKSIYPLVPQLTDSPSSWKEGSAIVKDRLVGNSTVQAAMHFNGQDPRVPDNFKDERMAVWSAFQASPDTRYNVDTQSFFVTRPDGSTSPLATLGDVQRAQASGQTLEDFFSQARLRPSSPTPTFGSAAPTTAGSPNQTSATGATLLPPFGTLGTTPNPGAAQLAFTELNNSNFNDLPLEDFLNQVGAIRQTGGSRGVAPVNGPGQKGPFTVVAHRYFDQSTGQYVPVSDVLIAESGNFRERTRNYNPAQYSDFEAVKPDAETGKYYQVTVTWADGKQKVWDYRMDQANGTRVDMWSPLV